VTPSGVAQSGSTTEDTARYSVITGARLLSVEEIREHGRAARQHIANADAALARAGLSLREAERISDEVLVGKNSKPDGGAQAERLFDSAKSEGATPSAAAGEETCSCCRKCGATVPCFSVLRGAPCEHKCFCGLDVSNEEADRVADELVGPVLSTALQRVYCNCGCGSKVSAYNAALDYALLGYGARCAVESIAMHYDLGDVDQELLVEEIEEEVADRIRMGRMAP
jgi:hypothetical protein